MVHCDTINKCGDSDFPTWVERLRGQIKEREGAKEGLREDKNVGGGEGEGELIVLLGKILYMRVQEVMVGIVRRMREV